MANELFRTQRGRRVAYVSLAALLLVWSRRAKASRPERLVYPAWEPQRYVPGSSEQVALFEQAAPVAGVPTSWASNRDFITVLRRESNGWVGIPNYQYGDFSRDRDKWPQVWAELRSPGYECPKKVEGVTGKFTCATGLGQMIPSNVDAYYPDGRAGIGDALNEAIGMLRYIKARYGTPSAARAFHDEHGWY
ncbi:MAG: hypothetical protein GTN78_21865 [Gemmatimonadales bacterium]|nr:hypothetical protein [Gemmatimonadales bacterium]